MTRPLTDAEMLTHYRQIVPCDLYNLLCEAYDQKHGKGAMHRDAIRETAEMQAVERRMKARRE